MYIYLSIYLSIYIYIYIYICVSVFQWLRHYVFSLGVPWSKPLGGSKVDLAFHPSGVNTMSTMDFWELSGKR